MIETQSPGVKSLPLKTSDPIANAKPDTTPSIHRITDQRETKMLQVHSNLMRATSL